MFPIPSHLPATIFPATRGSESHSFKLGLVRGFEGVGIQRSVNEQLIMQREIGVRAKVLKKKRKTKNGKQTKQNKFNMEHPSSLMYDSTVAPNTHTDSQTLHTGTNTGGAGRPPMTKSSWNSIVQKERSDRLDRLSTPVWKKKPTPKHSLTALLGDPNVFTPNIASRQSLLSSEGSRLNNSPLQNQQSILSNHTNPNRASPSTQHTGFEKPSLSSSNSRQHRRASIDITSKSNNVPLLQTFNKYNRKKTKRTPNQIQTLRDAVKPKVTVINYDGEKVEQIEEVMLIDQPSPRSLQTKAKSWKAPFTDLHGTFYDSDLEEGEQGEQQEEEPEVHSQMNETQRNHYVESSAKPHFQKLLRHVSEKRLNISSHFEKDDQTHPTTTIKKYIKPILERNRPPLTLILKQTGIKSLNLNGLGVGDDYGVAIGACISDLDYLEELRLGDNRLTDGSIVTILEGVGRMGGLRVLELHENDVDERGAEALRVLLTSGSCKLENLTLDHTDVDDSECCLLMDSLCSNQTLKKLTMSNNLIGQGEALNTCQPGLTTGPEAVAKMLRVNKTLTELDLSWNSIMGDSAVELATSIRENSTLEILNLKQNSFSEHASQELGRSLIDNKGLKVLDLSYNQVSIRGAMVMATALKVNQTIRQLILDGNTIGRLGSEHLMSALRENAASDREFKLSMLECDVTQEDVTVFDSQFPTKPDPSHVPDPLNKNPPFPGYVLNLETPYGFMVASSLLHLANSKEGCKFTSIKHEYMVKSGRKSRKKTANIKLKRGEGGGVVDKMRLWRELAKTVNGLGNAAQKLEECMESCGLKPSEKILDYIYEKFCEKMDVEEDKISKWDEDSCWMHVLACVFEFTDKDGSGALNCDELLQCLAEIGVMPSREFIKQVIAEYDVDGAGEIEQDEFVAYMLQKYASTPPEDKPDLVEAKSGAVWQVPRDGVLYVEFLGVPSPPTADEIGSDEGIDSLVKNIMSAKDESDRQKLFEVASRDCKIFMTAVQAQRLIDEIKHGFQKIDAVRMLLPQLSNSTEAVRFVETNLDWEGKLLLRINLGQGWKPIMGMLSGHYDLDFTQGKDRTASKKLSEQATLENRFSQFESGRMDTSQRGNWENFRNGTVDGSKVGISSSFFNKAMGVGKVRFDYVCTTRPRKGTKAMGGGKFAKLLKQVGLEGGAYSEKPEFFQEHLSDGVIREHWLGWQKTTRRQFELDRALEEKKRLELLAQKKIGKGEKGGKGNKKKKEEEEEEKKEGGVKGGKKEGEGEEELEIPPEPLPPNAFTLEIGEEEVIYVMPDFTTMAPSDRYRGFYCGMMAVETAITSKYLRAKQAWEIVKLFPEEEDGIRVEMAMVLFSRVVDIDKFGAEILDKLTELEQRELNWRLGISNLFNGVDIDRKYWIDLTCYDEREIFMKLIKLSLVEPNAMKFSYIEYRREWKTEIVPGLGINEKWLEDVDNVPNDMGELCFVYKTGGKTHMNGFYESNANNEARKELRAGCFAGSKQVF